MRVGGDILPGAKRAFCLRTPKTSSGTLPAAARTAWSCLGTPWTTFWRPPRLRSTRFSTTALHTWGSPFKSRRSTPRPVLRRPLAQAQQPRHPALSAHGGAALRRLAVGRLGRCPELPHTCSRLLAPAPGAAPYHAAGGQSGALHRGGLPVQAAAARGQPSG